MPLACWKQTNSPWGKSYDNRGNVCHQNGTVALVEAGVVLGILGAILVGLGVGWVVRYSRKASRFRAFWNQAPVNSHALASTASLETYELKNSAVPRSPGSPRSPRSDGEKTLHGSNSMERMPKYAVPRSTSRPQSMMGSSASISSRRSSFSGSTPSLRPISTVHPPVRSSPLASGQPKPSLTSRLGQGSTSGRSPLASGSGSGSSEESERGVFLQSMQSGNNSSPLSPPDALGSYGNGGLTSPREFGSWDSSYGDNYHPSSPGRPSSPAAYDPHISSQSQGYNPQPQYPQPPRPSSPSPSVGQIFHHQPPPPPQLPLYPPPGPSNSYRPSTPTRAADLAAAHSPLDRLSFAHPNGPHPGPPQRVFSDVSEASSGGYYSPPGSPRMNFSRPSSRQV